MWPASTYRRADDPDDRRILPADSAFLRGWAVVAVLVSGLALAGLWVWRDLGSADSGDAWFGLTVGGLVALLVGMAAAWLRASSQRRIERDHAAVLEDMARFDELTGLYTYRELRTRLREYIEAARASSGACTLILFDLEHFRQTNERCGHAAGDGMLAEIARAMRDAVGGRGSVGRFGGDEFAVVLRDCSREEAHQLCGEIEDAVAEASVRATPLNRHLRVGVSCGIARFPDDAEGDDQLIAAADSALHVAMEHRTAEAERTSERHAQDVFFSIAQAMGQSLDAQATLDNFVRAVGGTLNLDTSSIRLFGDADRAWVRSYYIADPALERMYAAVEAERPVMRDEIIAMGLLSTGITYIDDMRTSDRLVARYREVMDPGMWMITAPLPGEREGMLVLTGTHQRTAPPPGELVHAIARLAEAALQNCDVYEAAKRQGEQLSRLAGIGGLLFGSGEFEERLGALAREVGEAFDVDALTIDTVDPEGEKSFCRHVYARRREDVTPEEHADGIASWRSLRPQLTEPDTAKFLAELTAPVVIDDAMNSPLVVDAYRDVVRENGIQTVVLVPITWQNELKGLFYFTSYRLHAFNEHDVTMMRTVAAQIAPSLQIATLHVDLKHSYDELKEAHLEAILRLAYAAEARDPYTGRHLHRIKAFSGALAKAMGLEGEDLEQLGYGAVVHDLGKLRIPDSILIKAGELSDDEWKVMKRHPEYGAEFLGSSSFYDVARQVAMHHHERWDGSGYPRGLVGEAIPLAARIVSVADVYDALTSDRPYKVAWPPERALAELLQMRGKSLCPYSVDAFLRLWNDGTIAEIERESGHASFEFDFRERYAA